MTHILFRWASVEHWAWSPIALVVACTLLGIGAEHSGLVRGWYASPYVLVSVIAAIHGGRKSGYLAAALSMMAFNFVFVTPQYAFTFPSIEELVAYVSMFAGAFVAGGHAHPPSETSIPSTYKGPLPFVREKKDDDQRRMFWDVLPSGDWTEDCLVGTEFARIYSLQIGTRGAPLLSWIVRDMIHAGRFTGVEAGFINSLPIIALAKILPSNHNTLDP